MPTIHTRQMLLLALPLIAGAGALYAARAPKALHAQVRQQVAARPAIWPSPPDWRPPPIWRPAFQQVLTIDAVHIRTAITGDIAQTEVEQTWRNDTDRPQEGSYLFPLPEGATVSDFALHDGDRKMVGRLLDKNQAADTYEGSVRRQQDPALLRYVGRGAYEVKLYPDASELPDLFSGSQLLIAGRYTGFGAVTARLSGMVGGKPVSYALSTTLPAVADTNDFLPRLWATRKIGYLLDSIRLRKTDSSGESGRAGDPELMGEIVRLSKEYGIITPYTSFLVTDGSEEARPFGGPIPMHGIRPSTGPMFAPSPSAGGGFGGVGGGFPGGGAPAALALPPGVNRVYALSSGAVATSQSQALRATKSANVASGLAGYDADQTQAVGDRVRTVGAKTFTLKSGVWTDSACDALKQKDVLTVKAFSDAHFALLKKYPSLAAYTSLGNNVLVVMEDGRVVRVKG